MRSTNRPDKSAIDLLKEIDKHDPEMLVAIEEARTSLKIAQAVYDARMGAGLSQAELAAMIGTKPSVIARLEDADYERHSLPMLQRVARALNRRIEVTLLPDRDRQAPLAA